MSFTFALSHLWVMAVLLFVNVLYFANVTLGGPPEVVSIAPWPLAEAVPEVTAETGVGTFVLFFLTTCVFAPFVEEAFRAAILQGFCEDEKTGEMKKFFIILAMSVIFFGMIHGGYWNILIQGALGLLLARLWFKVGRNQKWQYLSMVAVHAAYNFSLVGVDLMVLRALN